MIKSFMKWFIVSVEKGEGRSDRPETSQSI